MSAEDFEVETRFYLAQVPPLRGVDPMQLAFCQLLNLQLASFDQGLCKAAPQDQVAHHLGLSPN